MQSNRGALVIAPSPLILWLFSEAEGILDIYHMYHWASRPGPRADPQDWVYSSSCTLPQRALLTPGAELAPLQQNHQLSCQCPWQQQLSACSLSHPRGCIWHSPSSPISHAFSTWHFWARCTGLLLASQVCCPLFSEETPCPMCSPSSLCLTSSCSIFRSQLSVRALV